MKLLAFSCGPEAVSVQKGRKLRSILPHLALLLLARPVLADSSPWGLQNVQRTGISTVALSQQVLDPDGNLYLAPSSPTGSIFVKKVNTKGAQIFAAYVPGEVDSEALIIGPGGNVSIRRLPPRLVPDHQWHGTGLSRAQTGGNLEGAREGLTGPLDPLSWLFAHAHRHRRGGNVHGFRRVS